MKEAQTFSFCKLTEIPLHTAKDETLILISKQTKYNIFAILLRGLNNKHMESELGCANYHTRRLVPPETFLFQTQN